MSSLHFDLTQPRRSMGYLSGPMSSESALNRELFRLKALETAAWMWDAGVLHYSPHANSPAVGGSDLSYETWMAMDLEVLRRCDWILMGEGWQDSLGCAREFNFAMNLGLKVLFTVEQAVAYARDVERQWQEEAQHG